ncbi:MAG: hypothetical protein WA874_14520 [Chryseosolibacter sp.]
MNNSVAFILFGFLLTAWTCIDETAEELHTNTIKKEVRMTYTIPAGSHYSTESSYQPLNVSSIKFKARFDSSAIYQTSDLRNQGDINKLYGMSDCGSTHQNNSARFGWRWFENSLQVWAYAYVNGDRKMTFIRNVALDSTATYELQFTNSTYTFRVDEVVVSLPRHCAGQAKGYKLYPYFGGDEPAPHAIRIDIEEVK